MTGVVAGNMISQAITTAAISDALAEMQTNLANTFDNLTASEVNADIVSDTSDYEV